MKPVTKQTLAAVAGLWGSLGFMRGINNYKYNTNKCNEYYLYSTAIRWGFGGTIAYLNPVILPIILSRELYRLEVHLRPELHDEKNKAFYNELI